MNTDKNKLQKSAPTWHAQVAAEINREFAETDALNETARKRRARLGLMLIWVKAMGKADGSIPHGGFGKWLEVNCRGISRRTAGNYLVEGGSICDLLQWQIGKICHFEVPPHQLLSAKVDDLSGDDKSRAKQLAKVIEEQAQFSAITKYQQVELQDDELVPKRGRVKGEGGKPAAAGGDLEEIIAANAAESMRHMGKIVQHLDKLNIHFLSQPDDVLTAFLASLDRTAKCAREHLATPPAKRTPQAIEKLWRTL